MDLCEEIFGALFGVWGIELVSICHPVCTTSQSSREELCAYKGYAHLRYVTSVSLKSLRTIDGSSNIPQIVNDQLPSFLSAVNMQKGTLALTSRSLPPGIDIKVVLLVFRRDRWGLIRFWVEGNVSAVVSRPIIDNWDEASAPV